MGQPPAQRYCWAALLSAVTALSLIPWREWVHAKRKQQVFIVKLREQHTHKGHWGKLGAELNVGMRQGRRGAADWQEFVKMAQTAENKS